MDIHQALLQGLNYNDIIKYPIAKSNFSRVDSDGFCFYDLSLLVETIDKYPLDAKSKHKENNIVFYIAQKAQYYHLKDELNQTPLHILILKSCSSELISSFIKEFGDIGAGYDGSTGVELASTTQLLKKFPKSSASRLKMDDYDQNDAKSIDSDGSLTIMGETDEVNRIKKSVDSKDQLIIPNPFTAQDVMGHTPLHDAVYFHSSDSTEPHQIIKSLLSDDKLGRGYDALFIKNYDDGFTPLHLVTNRFYIEADILTTILNSTPQSMLPMLLSQQDITGLTPLHHAASHPNSLDKVQCLVEAYGGDQMVKQKALNGFTPLHLATHDQGVRTQLLLRHATIPDEMETTIVRVVNDDGDEEFVHCTKVNTELVSYLVKSKYGKDALLSQDLYGFTPLHISAMNIMAEWEMIKALVESEGGVDVVQMKDYKGRLALHLLARHHNDPFDGVEGLIEYFIQKIILK
jgi:ankyrin repeat protein